MAAPQLDFANALDTELLVRDSEDKDLLRFSTAGSVDDGKSTLIGRLLYDCNGAYEDQIASLRNSPVNRSSNDFDLALLTDGLRAEREQGITIDVAYRYFSTSKRKFIIADTPGHEEYTRNMVTGASTSELAIILVDARNGILAQTRRHAFIASTLGIRHIVLAVNKMDLIDYREDVFAAICSEFTHYASRLNRPELHCIPISALKGDNVAHKSPCMPWYNGPSLLDYLEMVEIKSSGQLHEVRFPVQYVIRPDQNFRGYAGQIASGVINQGDVITVLPSGRTSRVRSIVTYDGNLSQVSAPMSVVLRLDDELDLSRGDMIADPSHPPQVTQSLQANVVWLHDQPLELRRPYLLKHTSHIVRARVESMAYRMNIDTLEAERSSTLALNDVGAVTISTHRPLFCDCYERNRLTGSFILIDPMSNATVAAGMIADAENRPHPVSVHTGLTQCPVTRLQQEQRAGHRAFTICIKGDAEVVYRLERLLFDAGCRVHALRLDAPLPVAELCQALNNAGMIAICPSQTDAADHRIQQVVGHANVLVFDCAALGVMPGGAANRIYTILQQEGWFINK
jgi:sulfate adenylyltransferase large subunit